MYEYLKGDNNKVMRVIGTQNGTAFSVEYAAEPGSYDEYLPTAQRMIDSLTISLVDSLNNISQTPASAAIQTDRETSGINPENNNAKRFQPKSINTFLITTEIRRAKPSKIA